MFATELKRAIRTASQVFVMTHLADGCDPVYVKVSKSAVLHEIEEFDSSVSFNAGWDGIARSIYIGGYK